MANGISLEEVHKAESALLDIVFVHGLSGNDTDTWTSANGNYWPAMISNCLPDVSVFGLNYPSGYWWNGDGMDSFEKSLAILNYLTSKGIGKRPFAIICHSLGGIITKMMMRKSSDSIDEQLSSFSENCRHISFLAVPHDGNNFAEIATSLSISKDVYLIANHSGYLQDLNNQFRIFASKKDGLKIRVFYGSKDNIVSRTSADFGLAGIESVAIDADHQSICKPENKDAPIHCSVISDINSFISELQPSEPEAKFTSDDYGSKSERDRRSLEQKLQDANRSYQYELANEHQNKFAQDYMRNGLSPSAKKQNDDILAEVEQRFETHVYPLIRQDKHHPNLQNIMQAQVIDPVKKQFEGRTGFTTQTVQRAIYYLTEQCHIRWDPE